MNSIIENPDVLVLSDAGFASFFYQLYASGKYTDVHFKLEFEKHEFFFSAHKFVLSLRSSYFADEFKRKDKPLNCIQLNDIDPKYFGTMLNYMYDYRASMKTPTPKEISGIYEVAKKFLVTSLMNFCQEKLNQIEITPSNLFDMLKAADCLQNACTKDRCLNVFQEKTKEVFFAADYALTEISPSMISFLLTSKKLSLDSLFYLFMWLFEWAKRRYKTDASCYSPREALIEFFPQLPFASLKVEEFANLYNRHDDFFNKNEVIEIFMNYALPSSSISLPNWYDKECRMEIKSQID